MRIDLSLAALHYSLLYFAMILLAASFRAFGNLEGKKKRCYIFLAASVLFVLMAFRDVYMGNDTSNYVAQFNRMASYSNPFDYIQNTRIESGFLLLEWILSRFSNDARILFAVSSAIIMLSVGRFANKHVDNPGLFFCLLVGMLHFDFLLSGLRQSIAIAIFLFSVDYLFERKPIPYYVLSLVAFVFHNSSIVFFLLYPLLSPRLLAKKQSVWTNMVFFLMAFVSGFFIDKILVLILGWFPRYSYYMGSVLLDGEPRLAVFLKFLVFALLVVTPKLMRKRPTTDLARDKASGQLAMLNLIIIVIASNAVALMRFTASFCMCAFMDYCNQVSRITLRKNNRLWMILFTLAAFYVYGLVLVLLKTPEWQTTYPIQLSLWLN